MQLTTFNDSNLSEAQEALKKCAAIPDWIATITENRPYADLNSLYQFAESELTSWSWSAVAASLANHPRIGEKKAENALSEREKSFSEKEQGNIQLTNDTEQQLYQGNVDYEAQFGHIFLIRAAGRSAEEVLSELHRRLDNDVETERQEVIQQLGEIALLRLQQEITA